MDFDYDIAIIGAGAAGLTAGIYAGRSGVNAVVIDSKSIGGLTLTSPEIENYPGFPTISGPDLMGNFERHAKRWCTLKDVEPVKGLEIKEEGVTIKTADGTYRVGAVILTMGAEHRHLGVPGEKEFMGKGVSYCATCDGFFYKDKKVAQVGGGNTAALESLFLKGIGVDVSLVHRRDRLRAEEAYRKSLEENSIPIIYNTIVKEIKGQKMVESLTVEDVGSGETKDLEVSGVFIAVGMVPNNELAKDIDVELDDAGYIKVDRRMGTNIKRVYAAGDITGGVRQIVTACAEGATAALGCLTVLGKAYPF